MANLAIGKTPNPAMTKKKEIKQILLTEENTLLFKGRVSSTSVSKFGDRLLKMSSAARSDATFYIVLDSPGGSIYAGLALISLIESIPQKVECIAIFAASMAHAVLQACPGKRYLSTNNGVIMIHRAKGMFIGQFNDGEVESQLKLWKGIVSTMEIRNAKRMNYSLKEYRKRSKDEWWCSNKNCLDQRFVDEIVKMKCSKYLTREKIRANEHYYYSACPLIPGYLKYESN